MRHMICLLIVFPSPIANSWALQGRVNWGSFSRDKQALNSITRPVVVGVGLDRVGLAFHCSPWVFGILPRSWAGVLCSCAM